MAKLRLAYHLNKNFTASVLYWKQKYDNTDWQTENMQPDEPPPYMGRVGSGREPLVLPGRAHPELRRQHLPRLGDLHVLAQLTFICNHRRAPGPKGPGAFSCIRLPACGTARRPRAALVENP